MTAADFAEALSRLVGYYEDKGGPAVSASRRVRSAASRRRAFSDEGRADEKRDMRIGLRHSSPGGPSPGTSPGRAFLEWVTQDQAGAIERARALMSEWLAGYVPAGADGQVKRVGNRFALIAAAGELAAAQGILPWETGEATRAAGRCFGDARRTSDWLRRSGVQVPMQQVGEAADLRVGHRISGFFRRF
jgi:hypothetical protein